LCDRQDAESGESGRERQCAKTKHRYPLEIAGSSGWTAFIGCINNVAGQIIETLEVFSK
jgi:hypothetical protein